MYRVLYACTQLEGAYVEVLSRFRPDPAVLAGLAEITDVGEGYQIGVVPATWLQTRVIGEATLTGIYADVGDVRSLAYLRSVMAARLIHHNLLDVDAAAIRLSAPRRFTLEVSNHIYKLSAPDGTPRFAGIEYESRFGDNYQNWAIFERPGQQPLTATVTRPVAHDDPSLNAALAALGLKLARP